MGGWEKQPKDRGLTLCIHTPSGLKLSQAVTIRKGLLSLFSVVFPMPWHMDLRRKEAEQCLIRVSG